MTSSKVPSEPRRRRSGQGTVLSLGLFLLAASGVGCLGDDTASDDDPLGGAGGVTATGSSNGGSATAAAGARGGSGGAAAASGGTGGSAGLGTAGTGSASAAGSASMTGSGGSGADMSGGGSSDDAGAGETGIFVGMTAAHNAAREALGEGLPDLTWSPEIAAFSQQWSDSLAQNECGAIQHRDQHQYGENIALRGSTRIAQPFSPEEAVDGWVAEDACWTFGTISGTETCDAACVDGLHSNGCGHYTQVIWRKTRSVGCGYSTCKSGNFTFEVWVCNYDPPGNFVGQTPY